MSQWFNGAGQINANDLQEAAMKLAKYASILQDNTPSNYGMAGQVSMTDEQKQDLMTRAMCTQEGKMALAQAMPNP